MRVRWWWVAVLVSIGVLATPGLAGAEITSGGCTGSASFESGTEADGPVTLDADRSRGDVLVVPRSDTVQWSASTPASSGTYTGSVSIDLPFPLGSWVLERWSGSIETSTNSGSYTYDLPAVIPGGVEFEVSGSHTDAAGTCAGAVTVQIEGGPFGSVVTPLALVATAAMGAAALAVAGVFGGRP